MAPPITLQLLRTCRSMLLDLLNGMSTTATYATRAALEIFTGLFACQGLRNLWNLLHK